MVLAAAGAAVGDALLQEEGAELVQRKQHWAGIVRSEAENLERIEALSMKLLLTTTRGRGNFPAEID